jgi:formate hydrogenlyase subunit 6/NADH:ubiquinone oxidoreductase subunit I
VIGLPFKFTFDNSKCIQCGICGDVCPVNTLDFTRAYHKNIEDGATDDHSYAAEMTEYPIQVSKCIGCMICPEECPVTCITIEKVDKEPQYSPKQGPMLTEEPTKDEFSLSRHTHVRPSKIKTRDPWGHEYVYIPKRRKSTTGTWRTKEMD